jgi:hypothetical protein
MRLLLVVLACVIAPVVPAAALAAQAPAAAATDSIYEVRLRDGSVLYGRIVESTAERIVLVTVAGVRMDIPRGQVERTRLTTGSARDGVYWPEDPNATRLFFSSTARPLAKGDGYVSSFLFVLPFAAYGVTDRFTIAGGTPIMPEVIGRVWYVAPKYTLTQGPRSSFAVGGLGFFNTTDADEGSVGILYGVGTFGSTDNAVSVGAGWGYATAAGSSSGLSSDPVIMLGGERRLRRRVKLVTENWIYAGDGAVGGLFSGGFRFIGDRLSADLGVGGFRGDGDGFCCLPLVNFVWNFGGR